MHSRSARRGAAPNVPGVGAIYEAPLAPDLTVDGAAGSSAEDAAAVVALLRELRWTPC